jgi:hypothetical protein
MQHYVTRCRRGKLPKSFGSATEIFLNATEHPFCYLQRILSFYFNGLRAQMNQHGIHILSAPIPRLCLARMSVAEGLNCSTKRDGALRVENGQTGPSIETLEKLARAA